MAAVGKEDAVQLPERLVTARAELSTGQMEPERARYAIGRITPKLMALPEVMSLAGRLYIVVGDGYRGVELVKSAYRMKPGDVTIACDMAKVLWNTGDRNGAIAVLVKCSQDNPESLEPLGLQATYHQLSGHDKEATALLERIRSMSKDSGSVALLRANRHVETRRFDEAIAMLSELVDQVPGNWHVAINLFLTMLYAGAEPLKIRETTERWCRAIFGAGSRRSWEGRRKHDRIRVGYIGGTLCKHVVMHFMESVLAGHDRSRVKVYAYADLIISESTADIVKRIVEEYRTIKGMGDQAVVERILADEIDVLVDLGGHTDGSSLPIFAHRCAPVQVSFLAYPATTGMAEMDYKITDEWADPRGEVESYYSEKLWRLPRCAWAYEGVTDMRELVKQVAHDVPPAGELKLGAYNNLSKLDKPTARLWGRILSQIDPKIKLQLIDRRGISKDPESRKVLLADFEAGGVKDVEERLVFHPAAGGELEVLRRYGWIDLNLDPLGYSGTTTTCESLRFGVPTLTLPGRSHVSRVGYSLLHAVGLDEFVVRSEDEYVAKVVAWAKDPSPLRRLRGTLRTRLQESPLGDSRGLAKALEDAYEGMLKERLEAPPSMPGQVRFDLGGPSMGAVTFKMDG